MAQTKIGEKTPGLVAGSVIPLYTGEQIQVGEQLGSNVYLVYYQSKSYRLRWFESDQASDSLYAMLACLCGEGSPGGDLAWLIGLTKVYYRGFGYLYDEISPDQIDISAWLQCFPQPLSTVAQLGYKLVIDFESKYGRTPARQHGDGVSAHSEGKRAFLRLRLTSKTWRRRVRLWRSSSYFMWHAVSIFSHGWYERRFLSSLEERKIHKEREAAGRRLSLLLFILCYGAHPFAGAMAIKRSFDDAGEISKPNSADSLYIYSISNKANAPVPGLHNNALIMRHRYNIPVEFNFAKAFGLGRNVPAIQPRIDDWHRIFLAMKNETVCCPECNTEFLAILSLWEITNTCPRCNTELDYLLFLLIEKQPMIICRTMTLFAEQLGWATGGNPVVGRVVARSRDSKHFGIHNLSPVAWYYRYADAEFKLLQPQQIVELKAGMHIVFGSGADANVAYGKVLDYEAADEYL